MYVRFSFFPISEEHVYNFHLYLRKKMPTIQFFLQPAGRNNSYLPRNSGQWGCFFRFKIFVCSFIIFSFQLIQIASLIPRVSAAGRTISLHCGNPLLHRQDSAALILYKLDKGTLEKYQILNRNQMFVCKNSYKDIQFTEMKEVYKKALFNFQFELNERTKQLKIKQSISYEQNY